MYSVDLNGRAGATFVQGDRAMKLDGELMASGNEWVLYRASVGRWSDGTTATPSEVQDVVDQVIELLSKQGVRVVVE